MKIKLVNENFKTKYAENLLLSRGVEDFQKFINPTLEDIETYKNLENIEEAAKLIIDGVNNKKKFAIVVDCDVDGYTSSSIIYQYLKRLEPELNIDYYIHDGKQHGLEDTWELLSNESYDFILLPDAGSNDSIYAKNLNNKIIVIDHHIEEEQDRPSNMLIVNNQSSSNYKNKDLTGAGMAYQLCCAFDSITNYNWAIDYIDLAALGIVADMASGLSLENQAFWKLGLSKINNYFFMTIARKQGYSITGIVNPSDKQIIDALNPTTVAFYIVPMINAMIRVGTEAEKDRLFNAFIDGHKMVPSNKRGAKGTFEEVAVESTRECTNARNHQNKRKDEAVERLEQKIFKHDLLENKILFIRLDDDDDFPAVFNGLVAMQLSAKYKRPTIVARLNDEGYIRGSIRGVNNSPMASFKEFLINTGLFEYVQGHDNAAGCSILNSSLGRFHDIANETLKDYDFGEDCYDVNFIRNSNDKDLYDIIEELSQFKNIWSQKNDEPHIYITDINIKKEDIQIIGKNSDTLKINKNGITYIKFFAKDLINELRELEDIKLEVVGVPNLNVWNGFVTPQIQIKAYEVKDGTFEF